MNKIKSSFLYIYKLQKNSIWSIIHRISGIVTFILLILISFILNIKEYIYLELINYNFVSYYTEFRFLINFLCLIIFIYFFNFILIHIICGIRNYFNEDKLLYDDIVSEKYEISIYEIVFKLFYIILILYFLIII